MSEFKLPPLNTGQAQDKVPDSVKPGPIPSLGIKVVALAVGSFNGIRQDLGSEFMVSGPNKLGSWMKCVNYEDEQRHQKVMADKKEARRVRADKEAKLARP